MKSDYPEVSAFQRDALAIIAKLERRATDSYGLAIKRELQDLYDGEVNHGRLYPNLDELVAMGLVEKAALDKRTNEYRLTTAGRDEMRSYVRRLVTDLGLEPEDVEPVVMTDGGRSLRPPPRRSNDLPSLPSRGLGNCRLALLVTASDLLEARHLAPDEETRQAVSGLLSQVHNLADDLAERMDDDEPSFEVTDD